MGYTGGDSFLNKQIGGVHKDGSISAGVKGYWKTRSISDSV